MDTKYLFYITLVISIIVQIITGIIEIGAFFVKVPPIYLLIKQLLILELLVQFFEGMFYLWLAYNFTKVLNVTPKRYIDWIITTPTMLITLIMYLIYLNKKVENKSSISQPVAAGKPASSTTTNSVHNDGSKRPERGTGDYLKNLRK
jgi:hypothetical protein